MLKYKMEHKSETKQCQNCKNDFIIEPDDFSFYEKIKVPPPTFCPECRLIRRLANREERSFFKDICDLCGNEVVSLFAPESNLKVYCSPCWWSDNWDGTQYGKDYDFSRPFFEQFRELQQLVPNQATNSRNSTNCKYSHGEIRSKDCVFVFGGYQTINCYYCHSPILSRDSMDSDVIWNSDHAYETLNSNNVYNTKFVYFSDDCIDSSFLFNCIGCSNCFGCVNLRNQKYCIWNEQFSKKDYEKEILKYNLGSYKTINEIKQKFINLYHKTPRRFALIVKSDNIVGDDIKNTKNCQNCFVTRDGVENCKNIFTCGLLLKDSQDVTFGGDTSELLYEVSGSTQSQRVLFTRGSNNVIDSEYCENIYGGKNLFGCVKLRQKKYCILNKQYTKEEYEDLIPKIKKHMDEMPYVDKKGIVYKYGEFFPIELSLWAYNETWANKFYPLTKEQALMLGYNWREQIKRDYQVTIKPQDLPDDIKDVSDKILDEVIECEHNGEDCRQQCTEVFKILQNELNFYRQMNLALPHLCPNCRYYERLKKTNPPKLWDRKCMCDGTHSIDNKYKNSIVHIHGEEPCRSEFKTAISQDRQEIVYCKECYQSEFI